MKVRKMGLALVLALCGATQAGTPMLLSPDGLGPFRLGMTLADINRLLRQPLAATAPALRATAGCDYLMVPELPGVAFMFLDERLARIDVESRQVLLAPGVHVGDADLAVARKFPHALRERLDYVDDGYALILEQARQPHAISLQFEHGTLARMLSGDKRPIRYAERCL